MEKKALLILKKNNVEDCDIEQDMWIDITKYLMVYCYRIRFVSTTNVQGKETCQISSKEELREVLPEYTLIITNSQYEYNDIIIDSGKDCHILYKNLEEEAKFVKENVFQYQWDNLFPHKLAQNIGFEEYEFWVNYFTSIETSLAKLVKQYEVFLYHLAIGDTAVFLGVLHEFRKKTDKPICMIVTSETVKTFMEHCRDVSQVVLFPEETFLLCLMDCIELKKLGVRDVSQVFVDRDYIERKKLTFKGTVCDFLGIDVNTPYDKTRYQIVDINGEKEFVSRGFTEGKTVFLIPFANAIDHRSITMTFWKRLAYRLLEKGYQVVTNTPEEFIERVPFVFLDVESTAVFAQKCGYVVSARTGLSDYIAAFTDVYVQSIYPPPDADFWKNFVVKDANHYLETCSIEGTFEPRKVSEMFFEDEDYVLKTVVENILSDQR